jgi:sialidase-1
MLLIKRFIISLVCFASFASAEETGQNLFMANSAGYASHRIPAALKTNKGSLLAFCEGRKKSAVDTGDIDVVLRRSTDGGVTWSPLQIVWDDGENTCGNPCPVVDQKTGTIFLFCTWNRGDDQEGEIIKRSSKDTRRVFLLESHDDGVTWSKAKEWTRVLKKVNWTWYATGPGAGIQIEHGKNQGRLVIACDHVEAITNHYYSHVIFSDDHGATWQLGGNSPENQTNESEVVELESGKLMLNMRSADRNTRCRKVALSDDGGVTWHSQRNEKALIDPICQASIRRLSWKTDKQPGVILFSNAAHEQKRANMTVRASFDDGATWPLSFVIEPNGAAYSCLIRLSDEKFFCFYETAAYHSIRFVALDLKKLK